MAAEARDPVAEQPDTGSAGFLRVKLGGRERSVLDRREEPRAVGRPGELGGGEGRTPLEAPLLRGIRVYEVEPLLRNSVEQHRSLGRLYGVPAHVREDGCLELGDRSGPLAEALDARATLDAALKEHLHSSADAENRPAASEPFVNEFRTGDGTQPVHDCGERTDARHDETVGLEDLRAIRTQLDARACRLEGFGRGMNVAAAVVEDYDGW